MRTIVAAVAFALLVPVSPATAQAPADSSAWLREIAAAVRPGLMPSQRTSADCRVGFPDSLYLVSPDPAAASRPAYEFGARLRGARPLGARSRPIIDAPSAPDTLAVAVVEAWCENGARNGGRALRQLVLGRDSLFVSYMPDVFSDRARPLAYLMFRGRDGDLRLAHWSGTRLVDAAGIARAERARRDSIAALRAAERAQEKAAEDARAAEIRARGWPARYAEAVVARRVAVGMTAEMVREAWGGPRDINTTITAAGRREQWVYSIGRYVYLANGIVTAIQTSR